MNAAEANMIANENYAKRKDRQYEIVENLIRGNAVDGYFTLLTNLDLFPIIVEKLKEKGYDVIHYREKGVYEISWKNKK